MKSARLDSNNYHFTNPNMMLSNDIYKKPIVS